eukprot:5064533-Heterocapsa_arctica.AAC.1
MEVGPPWGILVVQLVKVGAEGTTRGRGATWCMCAEWHVPGPGPRGTVMVCESGVAEPANAAGQRPGRVVVVDGEGERSPSGASCGPAPRDLPGRGQTCERGLE